jgi:NAD(P)H-hydrate repair Nnr-like enzyme with NAD(P)H-hydrate dehydratase domain
MPPNDNSYWLRQDPNKAAFDDLIWSQPEHTSQAGKLLIIGGNVHGFSGPAKAFQEAMKAGAGSVRVLLPDILRKMIGKLFLEAEYSPSTPSGSFAKKSLAEFIDFASWSDMTMLAGDIGRNSETSMLLEAFVTGYKSQLSLTKDALDTFINNPILLTQRDQTLIVGTIAQIQKIFIKVMPDIAITKSMNLVQLVEALHHISEKTSAYYITEHSGNILAAANGKVSTTKISDSLDSWRIEATSYASVWLMQNPDKPFEAITTAAYLYSHDAK